MTNYDEYQGDFLEYLLEIGAIEIMGFDQSSNQFTYNLTQKCKDLIPELWEEHFKMVNELAFRLWERGIVEMTFDNDGVPMVFIKDMENVIKIKDTLIDEERMFLDNLIYKYEKDIKEG